MKRTIILLFCLLFAVSLLSACGSQEAAESPEEQPGEQPSPTEEVPLLQLLANPEDAVVEYGGSVSFLASAENYSSAQWFFCDPDEEFAISADQAPDVFPGLSVTCVLKDGLEEILLEEVPGSLNGWFVQCVFSDGNGAELPTEKALITVTRIPDGEDAGGTAPVVPEDVKTPVPTPNQPSPAPTQIPGASATPGPAPSSDPTPSTPTHTHTWTPVYRTVHHDAVTEERWIVDQPGTAAWDEETTVYTVVCRCGAEFSTIQGWQAHASSYFDTPYENDHMSHSSYQKPVTIHHDATPEVGHYETVTVKEAYDEQVVDYYTCSCGERKDP